MPLLWMAHSAMGNPLGTVLSHTPQADAVGKASIQSASNGAMLARDWQEGLDPAHFLVSEKLDGVRALWDGQALRFRSGKPIQAPTWFLVGLPPVALDGELWMGRRSFDRLSGIARKAEPADVDWREVRYMVFDMPGLGLAFGARYLQLRALVDAQKTPWLMAVEQIRLADAQALQLRLKAVTLSGGEGLMLHRMDALWQSGRSEALRKLKRQPDEDGVVLAHVPGKGQLQGLMGALLVQAPDGQTFSLGSGFSRAQRKAPPPVGSLVTYRYRERTPSGLPRFASFVRLRDME